MSTRASWSTSDRPASHVVVLSPAAAVAQQLVGMLKTEMADWRFTRCTRVEAVVDAVSKSTEVSAVLLDSGAGQQDEWSRSRLRIVLAELVASLPCEPIVVIVSHHDRCEAAELVASGAQDVLVTRSFGARSLADAIVFADARSSREQARIDPSRPANTSMSSNSSRPEHLVPGPSVEGSELEVMNAIDFGQLVLHYQPIVALASCEVIGVEALVRWNHPTKGLIPPRQFIPIAERSGLIVPLGMWVLREACRQAAAWRAQFARLQVGVNCTPTQLAAPGLVSFVQQTLRDNGLAPPRLLIDITEASLMADQIVARDAVLAMADLGVQISIDDFGSSSQSIRALKGLPIDVLKIDRGVIAGVAVDARDAATAGRVIATASAVGAHSLAEGVESLDQLVALRKLGCQFAQGFYFGRPVPLGQLREMIVACENKVSA
ncbi:MAG: EAL domain-containing protein [Candidatus Nanopelagicales bacterium]